MSSTLDSPSNQMNSSSSHHAIELQSTSTPPPDDHKTEHVLVDVNAPPSCASDSASDHHSDSNHSPSTSTNDDHGQTNNNAEPKPTVAFTPPPPTATQTFKPPYSTLLCVIKAGVIKSQLAWWRIGTLGMMSGLYACFGVLVLLIVSGSVAAPYAVNTTQTGHSEGLALDSNSLNVTSIYMANTTMTVTGPITVQPWVGIGKLLGAMLFPVALIIIVIAGGELFTGNVMYLLGAFYAGKCKFIDVFRVWFVTYFSNFAGSVLFIFLLGYLDEVVHTEPVRSYVIALAEKKVHQSWGVNFLRGMGCNTLVCLALWNNLATDDIVGKMTGMWWPCFAFVVCGFEHCVANMVIVPLALMEGASFTFGDFIVRNLIPATLGNILGGSILITIQYLCFRDYPSGPTVSKSIVEPPHPSIGAHKPHHHTHQWYEGLVKALHNITHHNKHADNRKKIDDSPATCVIPASTVNGTKNNPSQIQSSTHHDLEDPSPLPLYIDNRVITSSVSTVPLPNKHHDNRAKNNRKLNDIFDQSLSHIVFSHPDHL